MSATNGGTPVWFITGCSTGLGRALAERVLEQGHRCVVTARDVAQVNAIAARWPQLSLAVALDVTDPSQVDAAVKEALRAFGRIDVLVNNAGYGYLAAIEEGDDDAVRAMFDTNFFALARLTRRVLPVMRSQGSGHIINISSVGGLIGNPGSGYYCASKFAVEGLSEALAKEVGALGIRVTAVEPGPFRTDWAGRSLKQVASPIDAYARTSGARRAQVAGNSGKQAGDPLRAAEAIIKLVASPHPPVHLLLGKSAYDRYSDKLGDMSRMVEEWKPVTLSADFPDA
jgi:NAD(P)-dependent dehydrogenase (short-subunit alcohol dehydrogenase family)